MREFCGGVPSFSLPWLSCFCGLCRHDCVVFNWGGVVGAPCCHTICSFPCALFWRALDSLCDTRLRACFLCGRGGSEICFAAGVLTSRVWIPVWSSSGSDLSGRLISFVSSEGAEIVLRPNGISDVKHACALYSAPLRGISGCHSLLRACFCRNV